MRRFFSGVASILEAKTFPKTDLERKKNCFRMTKPRGLPKQQWPTIYFFSDDFGLRTVPSFRNGFRQKTVYRRFWVMDSPVIQKRFSPKNGIPTILGYGQSRHSETFFAKKRYTDDFGLWTVPSFRKRFRQKTVYRRFWCKEPRHSENVFAKKRYTDDFGLRSPVIQKTFSPKKCILPLS